MPLKNLVAKKSAITEGAIEEIVAPYARYYVETSEIGFTPECAALNNERKVLIYLVALLGWPFVTDNPPAVSTKPADLEEALSIPGGTLRPLLKGLKDQHLISQVGGEYSVREGNLKAIGAIVAGERKVVRKVSKSTKSSKDADGADDNTRSTAADDDDAPKRKKAKSGKSSQHPILSFLDEWLEEGFFKTPRTLRHVLDRLHEVGATVKMVRVSTPILRMVKKRKLFRRKADENGKEVWVYYSAPSKG